MVSEVGTVWSEGYSSGFVEAHYAKDGDESREGEEAVGEIWHDEAVQVRI